MLNILTKFFPKEYVDSIYEIDYKKIYLDNYRYLVFDIDNTIVPFDIVEPDDTIISFFKDLIEIGFSICLLSNNNEKRVKLFNNKLKLPCIHKAGKPKRKGIRAALALLNANNEQTIIIGDQIFTDIWGGNRQGLHTILVKPIAIRDEFTVKLKRGIERIVVNEYIRRNNK